MKSSYIELNCIVSGIKRLNTQLQVLTTSLLTKHPKVRSRNIVHLLIIHLFIELQPMPPNTLPILPATHLKKTKASVAISAITTSSTAFHSAPHVFTLVELHQRALKHWYDIQQNLKLIKKTEFWVVFCKKVGENN